MKFTREVNGIIFDSCEGVCWYCCAPQVPFGDWEIEHQTPRAQGGTDEFYNLVLACKRCNRRKGNRTLEQFRDSLIAHALNNITDALETIWAFDQSGTGEAMRACETISDAADKLAHARILFAGEVHNFRRKSDPRFKRPEEGSQT